ncbi:dihydrolipoyl dehydrogenase 1, mitochondrial [Phytophthora nicotianae INRA-310]|uniref:Dihydrolipoyl dehydrogenase 1, mitochondrial n=1 Tax=Phytophthora nicotianae (strain INRA-310) TaxID=761204 RepID=W2PEE5_PHYN3|nr:dihydrolipoyl dehydrogenase 1, mitochondrial [Phytophthora nicotianae INRA-310]ETM98359.1 dihydrolipoyl dehydrogenase 1, mitochondrial [Phytophthora nicotianae INRA-310]
MHRIPRQAGRHVPQRGLHPVQGASALDAPAAHGSARLQELRH